MSNTKLASEERRAVAMKKLGDCLVTAKASLIALSADMPADCELRRASLNVSEAIRYLAVLGAETPEANPYHRVRWANAENGTVAGYYLVDYKVDQYGEAEVMRVFAEPGTNLLGETADGSAPSVLDPSVESLMWDACQADVVQVRQAEAETRGELEPDPMVRAERAADWRRDEGVRA